MISAKGREYVEVSKSRHTEVQMIGALKQLEAGRKAEDVAREVGVWKHTIYAWKAKYGGVDGSQAQEAKRALRTRRYRRWGRLLSLTKKPRRAGTRTKGGPPSAARSYRSPV